MAYLERHAVMSPHGPLTCALWVLHCHAIDAAYHTPRLLLRSATKGCGKSTVRRALSRLVPRAYEAIDITGPTLFRPIGQWRPTTFIDEANEIDWSNARDLVGVINSGHCRDDPGVPRCVGPDFEVRLFKVFGPLCLALIGHVPSTIGERSIVIPMRKKLRSTTVERLVRRDRDEVAGQLARKAARWAVDNIVALEAAEPELPAFLGDRPADNWAPLLAIGELLGLSDEAQEAARVLSTGDDTGEDLGIQLLADIRVIFDAAELDRVPSATLVHQLLQMEERPWPEMGKAQKPLTANRMARLLRPFGVRPEGTVRFGANTGKGYIRAAFEDAWLQYSISSVDRPQPSHRHNPANPPDTDDSQPSHPKNDVTVGNGLEPNETATCDGVTVVTGVPEQESTTPPSNGADSDPGFLTCATCNGLFPRPARGRPPKRCPACRGGRITGTDTTPRTEGL
jgi:hypothetical protein